MNDSELISPDSESDTKTIIFREAARLFAEKGYHGVSMREISENARVTKPTIYYYFGNKEGIYKALFNVGIQYSTENIRKIIRLHISAKSRLVKLIKSSFQQCIKYPEFTKFFHSLFIGTEKLPFLDTFKKDVNTHQQYILEMIEEGIQSGEFGISVKPEMAMEIIGGVVWHFIGRQLNFKDNILSDQLAEDIVELLFKGLNE